MWRVVLALIVTGCHFTPGAAVDAAPQDGSTPADDRGCIQPVADWRFDEGTGATAADRSGHGNALTLMGTASWAAGHSGSGLSLPGGSWAEIAYNSTFAATRQVSVTAWIRPTVVDRTGAIIVKSARYGPYQDWGFYQEYADAMFICNWPSPDLRGTTMELGLVADQWTHLAFVLDIDAGITAFYKDGTFHSKQPITMELQQHNTEPIIVGTDGGSAANDFLGVLDDLTVWTRALTQAEVAALYAGDCVR